MKFSTRLFFALSITGIAALSLLLFVVYKVSYNTVMKAQSRYTKSIVNEVSADINRLLLEKVKTVQTLANIPMIQEALDISNYSYSVLSEEQRKESIKLQNNKWKSIKDSDNDFILQFTDNHVAHFLKDQQNLFKEEYGEIFLTNKFGALVASTVKLSTLAHGHKYWWLGAYNTGKGAVFFDDRGYDDSVGGYVLGLVVPVRKNGQITGILKCNLNILGSISELISGGEDQLNCEPKLIRSGGMIVYEEGFKPLSTQIPTSIFEKLKSKDTEPFAINDSGEEYLIGISEINLTKKGKQGYGFGGTFESIDHKKGNKGESWYVVCYRKMSRVQAPAVESVRLVLLTGLSMIIALVLISFFIGRRFSKPLALLVRATEKIGKGDFEYRIKENWDEEFNSLAGSFNNMADELKRSTTSIEKLEKEIIERKKAEQSARQNQERFQFIYENVPVLIDAFDDKGQCILWNKECVKTFGWTIDEINAQKDTLSLFYPDPVVREEVIKTINEPDGKFRQWQTIAKNGNVLTTMWANYALPDGMMFSMGLDITEQEKTKKKIETSLKEKETLLSEIHHRVKNNMQVIISLLRLQSGKVDDKQIVNMLKESENRILSMALVHEQLYQAQDFSNINFNEYIKNLVNGMFISYGIDVNKIKLNISCIDIFLDIENAIPCGLIINELVSNSLKYAFNDQKKGKIEISVIAEGKDEIELNISDNGAGIPSDIDIYNTKSMGLHLVRVLSEDSLEGKMALDRKHGTKFSFKLQKVKYKPRI